MVGGAAGIKTNSSHEERMMGGVNTKSMWEDRTGITGRGKLGSVNAGTEVGDISRERATSERDSDQHSKEMIRRRIT